jgi:hypothetical protein
MAGVAQNTVTCSGCGAARPPEPASGAPRTPCPDYGTTAIHIGASPVEHLTLRETTSIRLRRQGKDKPVMTAKSGASQSADGAWAEVEQVVDREAKRYRERVALEDGTVVKDYDGPTRRRRHARTGAGSLLNRSSE